MYANMLLGAQKNMYQDSSFLKPCEMPNAKLKYYSKERISVGYFDMLSSKPFGKSRLRFKLFLLRTGNREVSHFPSLVTRLHFFSQRRNRFLPISVLLLCLKLILYI